MKREYILILALLLGAAGTLLGRGVEWGPSYSWHGRGVPFPTWVSNDYYQLTDHYGADVALAPYLSPLIGAAAGGILVWWFLYAGEGQRKLACVLLCLPILLAISYGSGGKIEQRRDFVTYYVLLRPAGWIPISLVTIFSLALLTPKFRPKQGLVLCLIVYALTIVLSVLFENSRGPIAGYGG